MLKRGLAVWTVFFILLLQCAPFTNTYAEETVTDTNIAKAVFSGSKPELAHISAAYTDPQAVADPTRRGGRTGWILRNSGGIQTHRLNVDLADEFAYQNVDGTSYTLEVDYYDDCKSPLSLIYDAEGNEKKEIELTYLDNSRAWETAVVELDDAYFGNRMDNVDFRIATWTKSRPGGASVLIGEIRVTRHPQKNPVLVCGISTNELGNIFGNSDEQSFRAEVLNVTNHQQAVTLEYKVLTPDQQAVWSGSERLTLAANERLVHTAEADVQTYGRLTLEVTALGDGFAHKKAVPFSFVNTIDDGTKNESFGFCVQWIWDGFDPYEGMEVLQKSNAGFIRSSLPWAEVEKVKGVYSLPARHQNILDAIADSGISYQVMLAYGNSIYDGKGGNRIPASETAVRAFTEYTRWLVGELKKREVKLHSLEVWNEPNITPFNLEQVPAEQFGRFTGAVAETIHNTAPEIPVYTMAFTGLKSASTQAFFKEAMDTGCWKYSDGLSLHPYEHNQIPEIGLRQEIQSFKDGYQEYTGYVPPVSFTEIGYRALVGDPMTDTALKMAKFNTRQYILYKGEGLGDYYAYYALSDVSCLRTSAEDSFGHVECGIPGYAEVPYAAKETFVAEANMNKLLQNALLERKVLEDESRYAYLFRRERDSAQIMPVWTSRSSETFSFRCDADHLLLYDMYGNSETIYGKDGVYSIGLLDSVQYVEGNLAGLEVVDDPLEITPKFIQAAAGEKADIQISSSALSGASVKVEAADFIQVQTPELPITDRSVIKLVLPPETGIETVVKVRVVEGDKTLFVYNIPMITTKKIETSLYAVPMSEKDVSRWKLQLVLKNLKSNAPISGTVTIRSPIHLAEKVRPVQFKTIPHGAAANLSFDYFLLDQFGDYPITYTVETDDGETHVCTQNAGFVAAAYAKNSPVIDGVLEDSEWNRKYSLYSNSEDNVQLQTGFTWKGVNDLSATSIVMYDEENFYLAVDVADDIMYTPKTKSEVWMNDSVQFGVTFNQNIYDSQVQGTFTEISLSDSPEGVWVWRTMSEGNELPIGLNIEAAELAVKRSGNHTYYELKLPWSEITNQEIHLDQIGKIGFSMLVNDNDGAGRKGWIEFAGGIGRTKDTSLFSFLYPTK